jgi:hypothetical protein
MQLFPSPGRTPGKHRGDQNQDAAQVDLPAQKTEGGWRQTLPAVVTAETESATKINFKVLRNTARFPRIVGLVKGALAIQTLGQSCFLGQIFIQPETEIVKFGIGKES